MYPENRDAGWQSVAARVSLEKGPKEIDLPCEELCRGLDARDKTVSISEHLNSYRQTPSELPGVESLS
jgi:hypothetical protein